MPILTGNLCFLQEAEYQISKDSTVPENCSSAVKLFKWWIWNEWPENSTSWETLACVMEAERLLCLPLPDCAPLGLGQTHLAGLGLLWVCSQKSWYTKRSCANPHHLLTSVFKCQQGWQCCASASTFTIQLGTHKWWGKNPNDGEFQQILLSVWALQRKGTGSSVLKSSQQAHHPRPHRWFQEFCSYKSDSLSLPACSLWTD